MMEIRESTAETEAVPPAPSLARVVLASFVGTAIEWYDFFLYGTAAALIFGDLFFPKLDPFAGAMASFATNAVGFFARPVGGIVFGHFGDRMGRKSMLVTTLMLMGTSTFLIGVLPTYAQIGVAAPILLVILRFVQGFGVGGEWGGAVLMVVEHGHQGKRGLNASWVQAGVPAGLILANAVFKGFSLLPEDQFLSWGWRVPFLLGIALLGVGLFIRLQVFESPLFTRTRERREQAGLPFFEVFKRHPRNVFLAVGSRMAENGSFYVFTIFVLKYATEDLSLSRPSILNCVLVGSVVQFCALPLFGWLSDSYGRRPVYLLGAAGLAAFAFPYVWLVDTANLTFVGLAIALGLVAQAAMYAPQAAFFSELFGTEVRYTGASIGQQLAAPLAGGLAPMICLALLNWSKGASWVIAAYLIALAAITLVSVWLAEETHRKHLDDPEDSV